MRTPRQGPINLIDGCLERNSVDIPLGIANAYIGVVAISPKSPPTINLRTIFSPYYIHSFA